MKTKLWLILSWFCFAGLLHAQDTTLGPTGLSRNDTLTSSIYTIAINDSVGTISGFPYGTLLKDVVAGVEIPSHCTFNVINSSSGYQPLQVLNWDTLYVDVQVSDQIFFEVIAENGVNKIVYQLMPDSSPLDAFVTSDYYNVDQSYSVICRILDSTTVNGLLKYLTPARGATMMLVDKYGFERVQGFIAPDDRLVVTSQDGTTSKVYLFQLLCCTECSPLYIVSDVYHVDQIRRLIYNDFTTTTLVTDFIDNLDASPNASIKVVDALNAVNTDTLAIGDKAVVTADDQTNDVYYAIVTPYSCVLPYSAYVISDIYTVDQINYEISGGFCGILVSDFLANLLPTPGASVKVVDTHGVERTDVVTAGDYVVVTSADGFNQVTYKTNVCTGDLNANISRPILIYPNPASDIFNISGIPPRSRIFIKSILGQNLFETLANDEHMQFSLENQPAGIYFILISTNTGSTRYKLIVK